ncbi:unnamed protein product [Caenorhabditis brenneri]
MGKSSFKRSKKELLQKLADEEKKLSPVFMTENKDIINSIKYQVQNCSDEMELVDLRGQWRKLIFTPECHGLVNEREKTKDEKEVEVMIKEVKEFSENYTDRLSMVAKLELLQLKKKVESATKWSEVKENYHKWLVFTHKLLKKQVDDLKRENERLDMFHKPIYEEDEEED